jgi:hypothetical protein
MRWRRLLFALLLAMSFDAVLPFEPTAQGTLQMDDDLEEAAQLRARRDHGRDLRATTRARTAQQRVSAVHHVRVSPPRIAAETRRDPAPRLLHAADPGAAPPPGSDDH